MSSRFVARPSYLSPKDLMSGFAAAGEPGTDGLAALSKVVFSTTLSEPLSWPNTQLVTQDPVEAVREMKDKAATSMRTIGSLTLARSLLQAGLADRFRVVVFPGRPRGRRLTGPPPGADP
jgi:dihydrofolate reductase